VDPHYQLDLLTGLVSTGLEVDFIGSDAMKDAPILLNSNVHFYNLRGSQDSQAPIQAKIFRILKYYCQLIGYALKTDSRIFHIQWENKFIYFDRIILNIFYKMLGKKLVFTIHNVNAGVRDANDTLLNRLSLKFKYMIADHIIVHTEKMKLQMICDFNIDEKKISVIPHGINAVIPQTNLTSAQARNKLQIDPNDKVLLFFGNIAPYKGLKILAHALIKLKRELTTFKLIIAGKATGNEAHWDEIKSIINKNQLSDYVIERIRFIPDEEVEIYYKAADVLILPYNYIFQSGVLFVSYGFGLPAIATDVGSLKEDIIDGKTGFICLPENPEDLAEKITQYFQSDLYKHLAEHRKHILEFAQDKYSWEKIGEKTRAVYKSL
jgi:D-inositol-3-phosphate glycosyltransferase